MAPWIEIEAKNKEEAIAGLRGWQTAGSAAG
jgi:UV DNA damage repair endonuclease